MAVASPVTFVACRVARCFRALLLLLLMLLPGVQQFGPGAQPTTGGVEGCGTVLETAHHAVDAVRCLRDGACLVGDQAAAVTRIIMMRDPTAIGIATPISAKRCRPPGSCV